MTAAAALALYLAERNANRVHEVSLMDGVPHSNASSAGACSRQIAFRAANVPASDEPTTDAMVNFSIGDHVHELVQAALLANTSPSAAEVSWAFGEFMTGRHDFEFVEWDGVTQTRVLVEIKTVSEFAFEAATQGPLRYVCATCGHEQGEHPYGDGEDFTCETYQRSDRRKRQAPEGPKREHILQAALSAYALSHDHAERLVCPCLDPTPNPLCARCGGRGWYASFAPPRRVVDTLRVVYVRKTGVKGQPVVAEWDCPYNESWQDAAEDEMHRHQGVTALVVRGELAPRVYNGDLIADPMTASFPCSYCSHLRLCCELSAGVVPLADVTAGAAA